jgi:hypothetical protein
MINFNLYFQRIGAIGGLISDFNTFGASNCVVDTNNISQYFSGDDLAMIDGFESQQLSAQNAMNSYPSYWQSTAANIINTTVLNDNPLLTSTNTVASLKELIYQMQQNSQTLKQYLTAFTVTPTLVQGNGSCVGSVVNPDGSNCQMALVENVTIACTQDQNSSSGLLGNENFLGSGQVGYPTISWQYPGGSGASIGTSAINASKNNANGTLINNGDFETWASNVPANWEVLVGTPGSTIKQGNSPYTGTSDLQFIGNGSELTSITQTFGVDTASNLSYGIQYAFNLWVKSTAASGVLEISLVNGSNTIINDQAGTPNAVTKTLSGLASYTAVNGCFRIPQIVPSTMKLRVRLSTAASAASVTDIDRLGFGPVTTLYSGGPSFAVFSGSTPFYAGPNPSTPGDYFTLTTTNPRPTNQKTFLWLLDRIYRLKQNGLMFPTASSPTISDALITT